jgi:hypothetical protein
MLRQAGAARLGAIILAAAATVWTGPALANRANDMLTGKSDAARNRFFARFLDASGASCGRVGRNFPALGSPLNRSSSTGGLR